MERSQVFYSREPFRCAPVPDKAEDPEGDAIAWSLSGPDAALFQIDEAGTLSLSGALDFEALGSAAGTNDYAPTVVATDDGRDPVSQQLEVTVTLTDVNEEPTVHPSTYC